MKASPIYSRGFSTIEILVALAVGALMLGAVIMLSFGSQSFEADGEAGRVALALASNMLDQEQLLARRDFNLVVPTTSVATAGPTIYTETVSTQLQSDYVTKKVTATVSWGVAARPHSLELATYVTNFENASGSGTCDAALAGNWQSPTIANVQQNFAQLVNDTAGLYTLTGVEAYHGRLYVTASNSSSNKETFFIFTISGPTLTLVSKIDNDTAVNSGLAALTLVNTSGGTYAYVASASSFVRGQLQVIDVHDAVNPKVVATYKIPVANVPSAGNGNALFYKGGYVYLGLTKTTSGGSEFNIIDVHDPLHPLWQGGYSVGNDVNSLYIEGNTAYIASPNAQNVLALTITNPKSPQLFGSFTPAGGSNGKSLAMVGSTLYLGRTFGTNELYILNAINPASLSVFGSKDIGAGSNTTIRSVLVRSNLAFLLTNTQLLIYNISNPAAAGAYAALALPTGTTGAAMSCEGNVLYAASNDATSHGYLSIIQAGL